jgi:hypothetical protein
VLVPCEQDTLGPWKGRAIDETGKFTGATAYAQCDPTTHLWWGILGSFQDYSGADPIDPSANPTVTGWGSATIGPTSYRYFNIRVPSPWDWKLNG